MFYQVYNTLIFLCKLFKVAEAVNMNSVFPGADSRYSFCLMEDELSEIVLQIKYLKIKIYQ